MKHAYKILALLVLVPLAPASGQVSEIGGKVIVTGTSEPLPGAIVRVKATTIGTTTDVNGDFKLTFGDRPEVTLIVSYVGYATVELQVSTNQSDLVVMLNEDVLRTSEVVVTGLASSVKRQNVANSVSTISAKELTIAPTQTLDAALSGKFTGVTVSANSGAPGGGLSVNLRGVTTINGESQPLYVVDGVIIDNTATQSGVDVVTQATGGGNTNFQDNPVNRVADLNPNDIESIEILKGPSAAAIYGAKASNGVVIINTKRGLPGKTTVDVTQQIGMNSIIKKLGSRKFTSATAMSVFGQTGVDEFNKGVTLDYEDEMYGQTGLLSETSIGIRTGTPTTQFYISGLAKTEQGIIEGTGYDKYGAKVNVDHTFSPSLDISVFTNFFRTSSDRGLTNNDNTGTTFGVALAFTPSFLDLRPVNGVYPDNPFTGSNPLHTIAVMKNNELVNRTINSARLKWTMMRTESQTLDFIATGGFDFYSQENSSFFPRELQFEKSDPLGPGTSIYGQTTSKNNNLYLNLVHNFVTSGNTNFRTTLGTQVENKDLTHTLTVAQDLIIGQENVDQGATVSVTEDVVIQRQRGFFIQEEVDINNEIYLTAGVRGDASSANGDTEKYYLFPKASASIRLSQYGLWQGLKSFAPEFKLRTAFGATGTLPPANAKYTTFEPSNVSGSGGLLVGLVKGNPEIEPEKARELELGFDAAILGGDATVEFSYYRRNVDDLILFRELPPSTGFDQEVINGGEMLTTGIEAALGLAVITGENFDWSTRFNFYTTSSTIERLDVPAFNTIGFADVLGRYRIEEGKSATQIVGSENGVLTVLGDETPDFQLSWSNSFRLGHFDLNFLFDWKQGGDVINLTRLLSDLGGTTEDLDTPEGQARVNAFGITTNQLVEDGTYVKLREVSLTYTIPTETVHSIFGSSMSYFRIGVAGRNLLTFTDYSSYDPEVSNFGNRAIGRSIEVTPFPSARSFYFNIAFGL